MSGIVAPTHGRLPYIDWCQAVSESSKISKLNLHTNPRPSHCRLARSGLLWEHSQMVPTMAGQMPIQHSNVGQSMQHTFANGGSEAEFGPLKDSEAGFDPLKVPITLLLVPRPSFGTHLYNGFASAANGRRGFTD